ncbi:MAG: glycosyltransferase [Candidatus Liptonbacteria bacterium]|nr:glycosyltransferase [Candidatus Liptonbacteria bacterium]
MAARGSLTVIITAYNEADVLPRTFAHTTEALAGVVEDCEIIILDDASKDGTRAVAEKLAAGNPRVRVVANEKNLNQGGCFKKSIALAAKEYHCLLPGDDMVSVPSLRSLFETTGRADMSLIAIDNDEIRHTLRRWISRAFARVLQIISGVKLTYFNGPVIIKTDLLRRIETSPTFMFVSDAVVKLLRQGASYLVVPVRLNVDKKRANMKAVRRNFLPVLKNLFALFWDVRVRPLVRGGQRD